jgi:hypothetical protein
MDSTVPSHLIVTPLQLLRTGELSPFTGRISAAFNKTQHWFSIAVSFMHLLIWAEGMAGLKRSVVSPCPA